MHIFKSLCKALGILEEHVNIYIPQIRKQGLKFAEMFLTNIKKSNGARVEPWHTP